VRLVAVGAALSLAWVPLAETPLDIAAVGIASLLVALQQRLLSVFRFRREEARQLSHDELLFAPILVLAGPVGTVLSFALGALALNLMRRRPALRALFNTAQYLLASSMGSLAALLVGGTAEPTSPRGLLALAAGTTVFAGVLLAAFSGLLARLEQMSIGEAASQLWRETHLLLRVETLLGVVIAILMVSAPLALPVAALAAVFTLEAFHRWFTTQSERSQLDDLLEASAAIHRATTRQEVEEALASAAYSLIGERVVVTEQPPRSAAISQRMETPDGLQLWLQVPPRLGRPFTATHRRLVEGLANIGATALASAILLEERQRNNQVLQELMASKDEFLAAVGHEIRTHSPQ
jgi:signal transduction histidine kinase